MHLARVAPSDPAVSVPVPGTESDLEADGRVVDVEAPWWAARIAEGSVVVRDDPPTDPVPADLPSEASDDA
ncbi:MAG: hypothetical protein ABTQ29_10465 [Siculibacillus sp.]